MATKQAKNQYFDQTFLDEMKAALLAEKEQLETELSRLHAADSDYGREVDDDVFEVEQNTVNKTLQVTLEKKLRDVLAALGRIENGTYGICKYTGKPISKERLRARPTSSSSVDAKKLLTDEA